ncbi:uncharacterized protein BCR38DRAFT_404827 [Pseudomassariella vexata]|uniref:Polyketide synthase-like phosphopantetheine-binding domain-containing protein n=1 Tax=Pseudomassariella vexata TaxID=1141098 RepID=A0A1Y2EKG3_9PEZI|nr:uncharacterized protein BCR38DRAFT_404827 [Pseudomassariella vexata]ORY71786.1 hypothetical protein BCR38DRAFT_404827 [Pseudomassariella vexata]
MFRRVFLELSQLIEDGHAKPISPYKLLGYEEIPKALQLVQERQHFGKFVILNGLGAKVAAPIRLARRLVSAAVTFMGAQLAKQLHLAEAIDSARQLMQYSMDSLAAIEFQKWVRTTLRGELTTVDVVNAASLVVLCERVTGKMAYW